MVLWCLSYSHILELFWLISHLTLLGPKENSHLIPFRTKRWPILKVHGSHMALNHPLQLDFWCLSLERHFEARTVKLSVKLITTQNMAKLQHTVNSSQNHCFQLLLWRLSLESYLDL